MQQEQYLSTRPTKPNTKTWHKNNKVTENAKFFTRAKKSVISTHIIQPEKAKRLAIKHKMNKTEIPRENKSKKKRYFIIKQIQVETDITSQRSASKFIKTWDQSSTTEQELKDY